MIAAAALVAAVIIAVAVTVPLLVTRKHSSSNTSGGGKGGGGGGGGGSGGITGGNGSVITTEDGTKFTYINEFGGFWVDDPNNPFNNNAQAQSWVPPLNQSWDYVNNRIFGVNLGGWLALEPFITPAFFEKYNGTVDEWTLSLAMDADTASGGSRKQLEEHYKTFITEQDFAEIAGAGLGWVRIPLPFWAIEVRNNEPFLEGVAWQYFLKAVKWARKYGLRINLDLHTIPGSQNGYNHSGRIGQINFLMGPMGIANAQRALDYIRIITEFISQPEYSNVIPFFGFINEPRTKNITVDVISHFYLETHDMIRNITGYGTGNGAYLSIHDGFTGVGSWSGYMRGADRLVLDSHPYFAFGSAVDARPLAEQVYKPCTAWARGFNKSMIDFGITIAGEWSLSFNDCGKWVNFVGYGTRWEGTYPGSTKVYGNCSDWTNWPAFNTTTKQELLQFALSSMDSFPHWFFWTWKISNSSLTGKVEAPMWTYKLGLDQGWLPKDPRNSYGTCENAGVNSPVTQTIDPSATGSLTAGAIVPTFRLSYGQWPPATLVNISDAGALPTYTYTGAVPTLPVPTFTAKNGTKISGALSPVNVTGCEYPDAWLAATPPVPIATTMVCSSSRGRSLVPTPTPTS
ncbi:glycoside hydrolase superfamily [Cantharellus anzutake]|uniref:glycoside hydrolase superfamily n=1 Tax=Cantharellus anzutake TaxID=1750568 RepID=UPI001903F702|nr:glycoside hydrolase superfamily [Cantharellus anzutake]KAF8339924.1 glycoside hydrolase superfamily [Cantharellus anzutake]